MRNPRNETVAASSPLPLAGGVGGGPDEGSSLIDDPSPNPSRKREGNDPIRSCILTRERAGQRHLLRLALAPDGQVLPDVRAKAPGRGAWIGVTRAEIDTALGKGRLRGALARAFKTNDFTLADDLPERIAAALERNALDRLGLESRSGNLLTGSDRIADAARAGKLHALYHASDAAEDGARKLAQAWRVGSDREGSDLRGLALPASRTILALALGRENVVHIGVTDRPAAMRLSEALDRWLHFIGPVTDPAPCETASQGASASELSGQPAVRTHEEFE